MRTWLFVIAVVMLLSFGTAAQSNSDAPKDVPSTTPATMNAPDTAEVTGPVIGTGTGIVAELSRSVNAKKVKPGDRVKAKVVQDVLYRGKVVMRAGSRLIGHVTRAKAHSEEDPESQLSIIFDKAELRGGGEISLTAGIKALAAPSSNSIVDKPDEMAAPVMYSPRSASAGTVQPIGSSRGSAQRGTQVQTSSSNQAGLFPTVIGPGLGGRGNPDRGNHTLSSASRGIFGLHGLRLTISSVDPNSLISNVHDNVKLDSGVQIVVQLSAPAMR